MLIRLTTGAMVWYWLLPYEIVHKVTNKAYALYCYYVLNIVLLRYQLIVKKYWSLTLRGEISHIP